MRLQQWFLRKGVGLEPGGSQLNLDRATELKKKKTVSDNIL